LQSAELLVHFDSAKELVLATDASDYERSVFHHIRREYSRCTSRVVCGLNTLGFYCVTITYSSLEYSRIFWLSRSAHHCVISAPQRNGWSISLFWEEVGDFEKKISCKHTCTKKFMHTTTAEKKFSYVQLTPQKIMLRGEKIL